MKNPFKPQPLLTSRETSMKKFNSGQFVKGQKMSPEVRAKMSIAKKGLVVSEETKAKISKANTGKKRSEEYRKKVSLSLLGKVGKDSRNWKGGISKDKTQYHRNRRNLEVGAEGSHTTKDWRVLKLRYLYMCLCCKRQEPEIKLEQDHIIPLSSGGTDYIENIQPLCRSCNGVKYTKTKDYRNNFNKSEIKEFKELLLKALEDVEKELNQ